MKNVLFVASECVPFVKTGGLADVVGSLPKYFDKNEFDVRVMVPKYACIPAEPLQQDGAAAVTFDHVEYLKYLA